MTYVSTTGATAAAQAAAIANAVKASGAIVKLDPKEFVKILAKTENPVVVTGTCGLFTKKNQYMINYKGFFFYTESREPIQLPLRAELVAAKNIWIPI
jgi:hypothetical protein